MNIDQLIEDLSSDNQRNSSLELLAKIVIDNDLTLIRKLGEIIRNPSMIENTNRFASILVKMPSEEYIAPLVDMILQAQIGVSTWLADYLYALGDLLDESEDYVDVKEEFVHLLGFWLNSTSGGEISWKAGIVLAAVKNESANSYLRDGAKNLRLFVGTRTACLRGYVNKNRNGKHASTDAIKLLEELLADAQEEIRDEANDAIAWLQSV
jgi:HEAT repeat protein